MKRNLLEQALDATIAKMENYDHFIKLEHFYSDINGTEVDGARLLPPSQEELRLAIRDRKFVRPAGTVFSDGKVVEVKKQMDEGMLYRDMYRIVVDGLPRKVVTPKQLKKIQREQGTGNYGKYK